MKKFYTTFLAIVFSALIININGQHQENETTGVTTAESSLKSVTVYDLIRLKIENPYVYDATVIYYYETFSDGWGPEDSEKMFNSSVNIPEIFTRIGNTAIAINGFSALDGQSYVFVPVSVRNRVWDDCEISADLSDFRDDYDVVLEDKMKGRYTNLRTSTYTYTPMVLGIEHERFVLHLSKSSRVATAMFDDLENMEEKIHFYSDYETLKVSIENEVLSGTERQGRIDVYSLNGRKLTSRIANAGVNQIELAGGQIYIVNVVVGNQTTTKKVAVR
jgi:hypothetical protein